MTSTKRKSGKSTARKRKRATSLGATSFVNRFESDVGGQEDARDAVESLVGRRFLSGGRGDEGFDAIEVSD